MCVVLRFLLCVCSLLADKYQLTGILSKKDLVNAKQCCIGVIMAFKLTLTNKNANNQKQHF